MAATMAMSAMASGCTHASANLPVDAPKLMAFQAPDIDEITGIDSDDADAAADKPATPAPAAPASANQAQKPHH
jgi:hypothetical protein